MFSVERCGRKVSFLPPSMEPSALGSIAKQGTEFLNKTGQQEISLSTFYPEGTEYFYSFPSGEDSHFYNNASPYTEELVAARAFACTGNSVKAVGFFSTTNPTIIELRKKLGMPDIHEKNSIALPASIGPSAIGETRNQLVKNTLRKMASPAKLIMAQPFLDPLLSETYQQPPALTIWLNDKKNIPAYVPLQYVAERIEIFPNGSFFHAYRKTLPMPCVVKVCSSSAGDGVIVCRNNTEMEQAKERFKMIKGEIFIEQYVEVQRNFCVQFGIPACQHSSIEIIGCSEQLTTASGEFLGGIVHPHRFDPEAKRIAEIVRREILPNIRNLGWYGVGGLDALLGTNGNVYIVDSNFRMTSTIAYLFNVRCGLITQPFVTFTGEFHGTVGDFERRIFPIARSGNRGQRLHMLALSLHDTTFRFNAAMLFDESSAIAHYAAYAAAHGIESRVLRALSCYNK